MVPGMKTGRRKKTTNANMASSPATPAHDIATPLTLSDETQPPNDTQTAVEETEAQGIGKSRSTRVRGPTLGKGMQKTIARNKGEKLRVEVDRVLNALSREWATPCANELGLQIRQLCPLKDVKSWLEIEQSTKDVVLQAVLDKFEIGDDFEHDDQAQQIVDGKAYLIYKDWRYNIKQHFEQLQQKGVDDPYNHPPKTVVQLDDWKYMIDVAWKDESHLKRSTAGKANRSLLPYNHTSGSRSFRVAMSMMVDANGELDFAEFYMKSHKSRKTDDWIHPKCGELHDEMVNRQAKAIENGTPLTQEELSRKVLGQKNNYLHGFGVGPRPSSPYATAARSHDKHMEQMRVEMEVLQEDLMKEKEERKRDREEMMTERQQLLKEVEDGKIAREEQQQQLNKLSDMVERLTSMLEGSNGQRPI